MFRSASASDYTEQSLSINYINACMVFEFEFLPHMGGEERVHKGRDYLIFFLTITRVWISSSLEPTEYLPPDKGINIIQRVSVVSCVCLYQILTWTNVVFSHLLLVKTTIQWVSIALYLIYIVTITSWPQSQTSQL